MGPNDWSGGPRRLVACLAVAAAAASAATATAQDAAGPPVLETVKDPKGLVSVGVPKGATPKDLAPGDEALLACWSCELDAEKEGPEIVVYAFSRTAFARAELAGSMGRGCRWGELETDSIQVKDGEWRDRRVDKAKNVLYSQRIVAAQGQVFFVVAQTKPLDLDLYRTHVDAVLASFKPLAPSKATRIPAHYKTSASTGREVLTDAKKGDVDRLVREWTTATELWPKVVPDKPVMTGPLRLVICSKDEDYEAIWGDSTTGAAPRLAFYSSVYRAVVIRASARQDDGMPGALVRATGEMLCARTYGGFTPLWWEQGLRVYLAQGVLANGHFDQPMAEVIEKARTSAGERNVPFSGVLSMTDIPRGSRDALDRELYAWHWYFRHGPGAKSTGALYRQYGEVLRSTGDVREAEKVFAGVDHNALHAQFLDWIRRWREGG